LWLEKIEQRMLGIFIKAILIGLCAAMPMGPIALLCIQKTMSGGLRSGCSVGVGSSIGDTAYAAISFLSIAFISHFLDEHKPWILVIGGILILIIGLGIALTNPISEIRQKRQVKANNSHAREVIQGVLMTFSNPGALFLMLGLVAFFKFDLGTTSIYAPAVWLAVAGVFVGTNLWWFIFTSVINEFRKKVKLRQLIIINRISGIVIACLGAISIAQGTYSLLTV